MNESPTLSNSYKGGHANVIRTPDTNINVLLSVQRDKYKYQIPIVDNLKCVTKLYTVNIFRKGNLSYLYT